MKNINNNRNDRKIPQQTHFIGVLLPEDIVRHRSSYNASYVRPKNRTKVRFLLEGLFIVERRAFLFVIRENK